VFDPFGDFETRGYLRNVDGIEDLDELKYIEHGFFKSNLEAAMAYLHAVKGSICYVHFLEVHRILFGEFCRDGSSQVLMPTTVRAGACASAGPQRRAVARIDYFAPHPHTEKPLHFLPEPCANRIGRLRKSSAAAPVAE
jgi:hypothetical protein